jgi:hypothetical protein
MARALAAVREEIDVRVRHGHEYGYTGYVLRPESPESPESPETA